MLMLKKNLRPEGGIEPLCFSAPTGLKPATRTTECHLDIQSSCIQLFYTFAEYDFLNLVLNL